jgi:sensor histidine kinase YesM
MFNKLSPEWKAGIYTLTGIYILFTFVWISIFRNESIVWKIEAAVGGFFFVAVMGLLVRGIDRWLDPYLPFERNALLRFFIQLIITVFIIQIMRFAVMMNIQKFLPEPLIKPNIPKELHVISFAADVMLSSTLVLSMMVYHFINRWKQSSVRASQLEKEKATVQYENLKNQLNPHFLFNSLSSLNSLIFEDAKLASEFLHQLSKVYRYLLNNHEKTSVTLEKELEFIESYIKLLETRFQHALKIEVNVSSAAGDKKIVPVTLQVLIENALKHNIVSSKQPLSISIRDDGNYLIVENNLQRKAVIQYSHKKGLDQLKTLYGYITREPVQIIETEQYFTVKIPLV